MDRGTPATARTTCKGQRRGYSGAPTPRSILGARVLQVSRPAVMCRTVPGVAQAAPVTAPARRRQECTAVWGTSGGKGHSRYSVVLVGGIRTEHRGDNRCGHVRLGRLWHVPHRHGPHLRSTHSRTSRSWPCMLHVTYHSHKRVCMYMCSMCRYAHRSS